MCRYRKRLHFIIFANFESEKPYMRSIFIKEINSFFSSIVGYVAVLVFLVACGLFLWIIPDSSILDYGYADLDKFFDIGPWMLLLLVPAITMRSFSDEFRGGTIEWLSTKPLTDLDIILGKYFATLVLVIFALIPTFIYVYTISNLSLVPNTLARLLYLSILQGPDVPRTQHGAQHLVAVRVARERARGRAVAARW